MRNTLKKMIMWIGMFALICGTFIFNSPVMIWAEIVGDFEVTGGISGTDYSYADGVLTILTDTELTIANSDPDTSTTDVINIADGVSAKLIFNGVNIDVSEINKTPAVKIADDSTGDVRITLVSGTENTLKSGMYSAGLEKNGANGTLEITGTGMLVAVGGDYSAGIGSIYSQAGTGITISGGNITANGGFLGAGIGGGYLGAGSGITITGGCVTAIGGDSGAAIGGGDSGAGSDITITGGSVKVIAGYQANKIGGGFKKEAIIPVDASGNSLRQIVIPNPNNEIVKIDGVEYPIRTHSETDANLYVYITEGEHAITVGQVEYGMKDMSAFTIIGGTYGTDYSIDGDVVSILTDTELTFSNKNGISKTTNRIEIADGVSAKLIFAGVNIDVSETDYMAAVKITDDSTGNVRITLAKGTENALKSGGYCAGLQKNGTNGTLEITGTGLLMVTGGEYAAGIGSGYNKAGSGIVINGGVITAEGGACGAGIGGGNLGKGSEITITGGSVKAIAGSGANKIGGGYTKQAVTPTDGTNEVFLLEIGNPKGSDIKIGDKDYPDSHFDENKVYVYLTGSDTHTVSIGNNLLEYVYVADKEKFKVDLAADDFEFEKPAKTTYDGEHKEVALISPVTGMEDIVVHYYKADTGEEVESAIGAGRYNVAIDVAESDSYLGIENITDETWTFDIVKAEAKIQVENEIFKKTCGDEVFSLTGITDDNTDENGVLSYSLIDGTEAISVSENGEVTVLGAGTATVLVSLAETDNFNAAESVTVTVHVAKKSGFVVEPILKNYQESTTVTEEINLAELLPDDCGEVTYGISKINGNVTVEAAVITNQGVLSYTAMEGAAGAEGSIEVVVTSQYYENIVIVVNMNIYRVKTPVELFVERMYTVALNRDADEGGLANWVFMLNAGTHDGAGIANEFILGEEFALRNLTDEQYVDVLYHTFFNRDADEGGKELWLAVLASGQSRAYVLSNFVNLPEFTILCASYGIERGVMLDDGTAVNPGIPQFVKRMYTIVLSREAENEGLYNNVMALVVGALNAEQVAKNFFTSEEYLMKNKDAAAFVTDLYAVFMNREADESGRSFWVSCLECGMTREQVIEEFASSEEFKVIASGYGLE